MMFLLRVDYNRQERAVSVALQTVMAGQLHVKLKLLFILLGVFEGIVLSL